MMHIARETEMAREGLYKELSPESNPSFATVMMLCKALGLRLNADPVEA
jgi:probable addiction module antidote protein